MRHKPAFFWIGFLVYLVNMFLPSSVLADDDFDTTLKTTYTVGVAGSTYVEHAFTITNKKPSYFISKYGLKINSDQIDNIKVHIGNTPAEAEIVETKNLTSVGITFDDKLVGEGKQRNFSISYTNHDIAQVSGKVLEVTIPKLSNSGEYSDYQVILITPLEYGVPTRITPDSYSIETKANHIQIKYDQTLNDGISAIFGRQQIFNLNLTYHLTNQRNQPIITQISLPPDTPYQKMNYQLIDPLPKEIVTDEDGNWIATYKLNANSNTQVSVNAKAMLSLEPEFDAPTVFPSQAHIRDLQFWQADNDKIKELAADYQTPKQIYDFVTSQLTYTQEDITKDLSRLGAIMALENPTFATCQEYTDLFISLARANSIPARRAGGFAYAQNNSLRPLGLVEDILHAWPEYYDSEKKTWIAVDPTWGDTTGGVDYFNQFDLNHIVFAINGASSSLPYPAGAYKLDEKPAKNVEVEFGQDFPDLKPSIAANIERKKIGWLTIPGIYDLIISNQDGQAWYNLDLEVVEADPDLAIKISQPQILHILPFQTDRSSISVYNKIGLLPKKSKFKLNLVSAKSEEIITQYDLELLSIPSFVQTLSQPRVIVGVGASSIIIALSTWSVLIFRQKRRNSLRGESQELEEQNQDVPAKKPLKSKNSEDDSDGSKNKNRGFGERIRSLVNRSRVN